MKKIIAICSIMFAGLGIVFGANSIVKPAMAEGEEPAVTETANEEETNKYKEMYEDIVAKYNKISNYQVLGTTIGGLVATLAALGMSTLFNALNKGQVNKLHEISRNSKENIKKVEEELKNLKKEKEEIVTEFKEFKEEAVNIIDELKKEKEALIELGKVTEEKMLEERQFFLSVVTHSKDMVASGAAEELVKFFESRQ